VSEPEFRLRHRGRSIPRGLLKLGSGVVLVIGALAALLPLTLWLGSAAVLVWILPGIWLIGWGVVTIADGGTDLISRRRWRRIRGGRELVLRADGARYRGDFTATDGEVTVPWPDVTGARFEVGPEGSWWYCLDTRTRPERAHWRVRENIDRFGTPLAVNLEVCPGARPRQIDRALRSWTGGRLRCVAPEPQWWRPPPFPPGRRRRRIRT
jgi:hypothetical protein